MLPEDAGTRLTAWLAAEVEPTVTSVEVTRLAGGHSSGAWRLDLTAEREVGPLVLKAPGEPSPVHLRDAIREARIMAALGRFGAPVPAIRAIDDGGASIGRPCFVMDLVEGWAPADVPPGSYHSDPFLLECPPEDQRAVWDSFHDALAALHLVDPGQVPDASLGPEGMTSVFAYWRSSLLDVLAPEAAPRQLALLGWLEEHLPPGADDDPAPCMGDARMVNCLVDGTRVTGLIDFEIAYLGNPAADIGYSLFLDGQSRSNAEAPLPGIPAEADTWQRWEGATGRRVPAADRAYWKAFGAMILAVTATRFMVQLGLPAGSVDTDNPIVPSWQSMVTAAEAG
jgi:aminoglycoside phosphotransferase (APT) family kinase protein